VTERNEHEERGDRRVFEPAIARLREELADFERQASATRALIEALVARAGPTDSPTAKMATATRGRVRSSRATADREKPKPVYTPATPSVDAAKQLAEIIAAIARSRRNVEAAIAGKDVAKLKTAMAAIASGERCGGEILIKLGGELKPLPVSPADRKRWRQAAARSPKAFDVKLRRDLSRALLQIGAKPADAAATDKAKPQSRPPAPARSPVKPARRERQLRSKLSSWREEPDGSLSRTLTAVTEGDAAAALAGA